MFVLKAAWTIYGFCGRCWAWGLEFWVSFLCYSGGSQGAPVRATNDFRRHGHGQQRGCPNQLLSDGCSVLIRVLDDYEDDLDDEDKEDEDEDQDDHDDDDDDNRATTMRRRHVATSRLAPVDAVWHWHLRTNAPRLADRGSRNASRQISDHSVRGI